MVGIALFSLLCLRLSASKSKSGLYILMGACLISTFAMGSRTEVLERVDMKGEVDFEYVVRSDAKKLPPRVIGSHFTMSSCSFRAESKWLNGKALRVPLRVISRSCDQSYGLIEGGRGRVIESKERRVALTLVVDDVTARSHSWLWRELAMKREEFRSLFLAQGESGSLVPGMVIGDTSLQESEFANRMRMAGLSHLTAVSGTNFSIIAGFILALSSRVFRRRQFPVVITLAALTIYVLLVRPSPSVLRAGVMALIVLIAGLKGERRIGIAALGSAVAVLLLIDPFLSQDIGFLLSVLATAGIITLSPRISLWLRSRFGAPTLVADLLAIPLSATFFTMPVIIAISSQFSFAQVPVNVLASPVVPWVTILGFLSVATLSISKQLASLFATLAEFGARPIVFLADLATYFPLIDLPGGWLGAISAIVAIFTGFISYRALSKKVLLLFLALALVGTATFALRSDDWMLFQCDVGQGDALLIRTGSRSAVVIDVGPDSKSIDKCLRQAKINEIPLLVITHAHADHYGGLEGLVRGRKVRQWWIAENIDDFSATLMEKVERVLGSEARVVAKGERYNVADLSIEVLWPARGEAGVFSANPGDGSTLNNRSLVLMIEKAGALIFAGGDIEPPVQEIIARDHDLSRVAIYKVSHHGSKFRSASFDGELNPKLALISVGASNTFGHPATETLEALSPALIHRTDQDGPARVRWWPLVVK
ncbi:MAG: ComEC/Rec2 family competence protein [Candidatus Nanopelagicaceae bacterium]